MFTEKSTKHARCLRSKSIQFTADAREEISAARETRLAAHTVTTNKFRRFDHLRRLVFSHLLLLLWLLLLLQ